MDTKVKYNQQSYNQSRKLRERVDNVRFPEKIQRIQEQRYAIPLQSDKIYYINIKVENIISIYLMGIKRGGTKNENNQIGMSITT